jgi:hypothetical protein
VWEADGVESSAGITASRGASFVINGKSDGNIRADAGTQVPGGLIGAALKPGVRNACVIGLGTGSTAGWLAAVPEIQQVDVMELEPAILHVLDNPKCRVLLGDAREMLITSPRRYDLIFSEPSNPYRAGIASLFTTEFYRTVKERLNTGGIFLQWVQSYEVESDAIRMILATLADVFPRVEVWTTQVGDLLLVATTDTTPWDAGILRARIQTEPFKTATRRTGEWTARRAFWRTLRPGRRWRSASPACRTWTATPTTTRSSSLPLRGASGARTASAWASCCAPRKISEPRDRTSQAQWTGRVSRRNNSRCSSMKKWNPPRRRRRPTRSGRAVKSATSSSRIRPRPQAGCGWRRSPRQSIRATC